MPTNQIINDVLPKTQSTATNLQTVFDADWTASETTDVVVYARAAGVDADDATQLISSNDYTVTFIGTYDTVRVTFLVGRTTGDIVTLTRSTPASRENLYTNTALTPSMLNQDNAILTLVDQQSELYDTRLNPHYNRSSTLTNPSTPAIDTILPILDAGQTWVKNAGNTAIVGFDLPVNGGGVAPKNAKYLLQVADADLPNAQAMGSLASGIVVNTATTGVQLTRTLTGTANEIGVVDGTGISGNPTFGIVDNPTIPGTEYILLPSGTTAQRPVSPTNGMVRYNTDLSALEVYESSAWDTLSGGLVDSVTGTTNQIDVDNTDPANPILSLSATLDVPGTFTIQNTVDIAAIIDDDTMATATATNIPTAESVKAYVDSFGPGTVTSVTGTANEIDIGGTAADPIVGIADNIVLPGTAGVTLTKGTVAQRAGSSGTLRFNTDASVFEGTLNGTDWVTIDSSATGDVDSIIGTANQVIASSPTGNVTLSLPQSIATTSDVTFGSVTFSPTTKGIVGTATNNDAAASYVGEYVTVTSGAVSLTVSDTVYNITSISLTAGDWDVFAYAALGTNNAISWYGSTSDTSATLTSPFFQFNSATFPMNLVVPYKRFSLAATTTIYLVVAATHAGLVPTTAGRIYARRVR